MDLFCNLKYTSYVCIVLLASVDIIKGDVATNHSAWLMAPVPM